MRRMKSSVVDESPNIWSKGTGKIPTYTRWIFASRAHQVLFFDDQEADFEMQLATAATVAARPELVAAELRFSYLTPRSPPRLLRVLLG